MNRSLIILLLIVIFGFILRFYNLGGVPVGFHRDEAFLGYNAYSIIQTGRDMTGNLLPIHLDAFLFSPAGYSYASIPFIALFGLNEFSVRFASAFFGTATIILVYFLIKEMFINYKKIQIKLALLSAFFLALSPWHINLSRVATENVIVVFFITLGVWIYLQWTRRERMWLLVLSFIAFAATLLLYQAPRAFLPFFIPALFLFFPPKQFKKNIIFPGLIFLLMIVLPTVMILFSHDLTQRMRMLSIFQNSATQLVLDEQIREDEGNSVAMTRFFHNKAINYSVTFFTNYFNHFSYNFLFLDTGFPDRYRVPQMGLLYFFELPLLLFGLWKLCVSNKKTAAFLVTWILIAPLGSALTYDDVPNLQRTLIMFPAVSIILAGGLIFVWELLYKAKFSRLWKGIVILVMFYGFVYYLHQYYVHQVNHRPWFRQEGYKELVAQLDKLHGSYKKVIITDAESAPAIFFIFYNNYDPKTVQKQFNTFPTKFAGRVPLENYEFPEDPCPLHLQTIVMPDNILPPLSGEKNILYVNSGNCKKLDKRAKMLSEVKRSDGTVVFTLLSVAE